MQTTGGESGKQQHQASTATAAATGQRRLSSQTTVPPGAPTSAKENRQPLAAFLSEDCAPNRLDRLQQQASAALGQQPARQSFLSKLTRPAEQRGASKESPQQQQQRPTTEPAAGYSTANTERPFAPTTPTSTTATTVSTAISSSMARLYGTECDNPLAKSKNDLEQKKAKLGPRPPDNDDNADDQENRNEQEQADARSSHQWRLVGSANSKETNNEHNQIQQDNDQDNKHQSKYDQTIEKEEWKQSELVGGVGSNSNNNDGCREKGQGEEEEGDNDDDDEDNQVIPSWPSRSDAIQGRSHEFIQHKVYSLKDYSQVASPTATAAPGMPTTAFGGSGQQATPMLAPVPLVSGKLLKSLSQERKVKANAKRMSECLHQSTSAGHKQQGLISSSFSLCPTAEGAPQASLLGQSASSARQATLLCESRIDRMRKLFVSPLSLRSSAGGSGTATSNTGSSSKGHSSVATPATATPTLAANPRLSLQAGAAGMLNKPHHLMHAVYRGGATHHSRRSPMRQKQGKSFRVYGCPLQLANNIYPITCFGRADIYKQQSVPYVLARLCNYIEENSSQLTHEGIFRVSGNARLMEKLRTLFDHLGDAPLESESVDVATSASMLKMYLRELPEPLIPTRMNYCFIALAKKYSPVLAKDNISATGGSCNLNAAELSNESQAMSERQRLAFARDLTKLVRKLPIENYNLLKYLACFLYRVSLKQQYNKMCAEALGIVFGPNVFRIRSESYKGLKEQELSNQVMASIIRNYKSIFDSELTDPLGNIVCDTAADEAELTDANSARLFQDAQKAQAIKKGPSTAGAIELMASSQAPEIQQLNTGKQAMATTVDAVSALAPMPSTSKAAENVDEKACICCPEHCQGYLYDNDDNEEKGEEENGDFVVDQEQRAGRHNEKSYLLKRRTGQVHNESDDEDEEEEDGEEEASEGSEDTEDIDDDDVDDDDDDDDDEVADDAEDEDDEVDEDDDCDEGESYTPSSGSGSYCSSMDSETLESSYDGGQEQNADLASRSNMSSSECGSDTSYTPTSSHTDSEPQDADASFYGNSSSFESSPTFACRRQPSQRRHNNYNSAKSNNKRQAARSNEESQANREMMKAQEAGAGQSMCLVCKRRQSTRIVDAAAAGSFLDGTNGDPIAPTTTTTTTTATCDSSDSRRNIGGGQQEQAAESNPACIPLVELAASDESPASELAPCDSGAAAAVAFNSSSGQQQLLAPTRTSRKRRLDGAGSKRQQATVAAGEQNISTCAEQSGATCEQQRQVNSGTVLRVESIEQQQQQSKRGAKTRQEAAKVRHSARQSHKVDFMRRRSSSASSLGRMRRRHDQLDTHKRASKADEQHRTRANFGAALVAAADRRRLHEAQARARGSARRTRVKATGQHASHLVRRTPAELPPTFAAQAEASSPGGSGRRAAARTAHGQRALQQHHVSGAAVRKSSKIQEAPAGSQVATMLPLIGAVVVAEECDLAGWDVLSAQCLEELECEKYFLLRPFNSDETLLRSASFCSEFSVAAAESSPVANLGASRQRRFSGHDLDEDKFARFSRPTCGQIFESLEVADEIAAATSAGLPTARAPQPAPLSPQPNLMQLPASELELCLSRLEQRQSPPPPFNAGVSFVSLLDSRFVANFGDSELSLRETGSSESAFSNDDPILIQMRATKELVRLMRRLWRHHLGSAGNSGTQNNELESLVLRLTREPNVAGYSDDFSACSVDHLAAQSVVEQLEPLLGGDKAPNSNETNERGEPTLGRLLEARIADYKQKYNDLKGIRQHYIKSHTTRKRKTRELPAVSSGEKQRSVHSPLAQHGSLDTLCQTGADQAASLSYRKLSVPTKEATVISRSLGSAKQPQAKKAATFTRSHVNPRCDSEGAQAPKRRSRRRRRQQAPKQPADERQIAASTSAAAAATTTAAAAGQSLQSAGSDSSGCRQVGSAARCKFGSLCPVEFVFNIEKQLAAKRAAGSRLVKLNDMTIEQLQSEKLELQKNLLRYEHWFGRPTTRLDFSLVNHLYERYRAVKMIKLRKQRLAA